MQYQFLSDGSYKIASFLPFPQWPQRNTGCGWSRKRKTGVYKVAHGSPPSGRSRKIDCSKVQRSFLADLKTEWQWWPRQCAFCTRSKPICPEEYLLGTKGVGRCRMLGMKPRPGASFNWLPKPQETFPDTEMLTTKPQGTVQSRVDVTDWCHRFLIHGIAAVTCDNFLTS